ncbi:MAG: FG-GAP repeat domain-containing protein, partial [Kiritimatiellia bacterium]
VSTCSLVWGDYDNDGDLDILLAGNTGLSRITKIYRNHNDGFTDIGAFLVGLDNCSVAWGDFDNDGDLDVLIAGNLAIKVYRNDSGTFTDIGAALTGVNWCSVAWGDFDNDGDLDLVIAGWATTGRIAKVYRNNAGVFVDVGAGLPGVYNCSVAWGDFDDDGDLDLLLAGDSTGGRIARIYSNSGPPPNTTPGAPASLRVRWDQGNDPILVWDPATDAETPSSGLTYNIRVGTSSGTDDVIPAMADCSTGYRRLPGLGNTGNSRTRFVLGTDPDSYYYWSVQAIDTAWAGGTWATEQRFRRLDFPNVITHPVTNIGYSSAVCSREVLDEGVSSVTNKGLVWATNQYPVVDNCLGKTDHGGGLGAFSDKLTNLVAGQTYYVRAYAVNGEGATYGEPKVFTTYTAVFTDIGAALAGVQNAAAAWGDYDNDGDLDLALAGDTGAGRITRIYRNDGGGVFTDVTAGLPGVSACSLAWGDYDNDGDLDLALAGDTGAGRITRIYRNDGGGVFTDVTAGLPGVSACSLAWGDYDNDGDLDLVAAGNTGAARIARIYRNDDGVFTDIGAAALTGVDVCSAAWGDYDNDGDLDLLLAGYTGAAYITRLYRNAGGVFVDTGAGLIGVGDCSVAWGDYD